MTLLDTIVVSLLFTLNRFMLNYVKFMLYTVYTLLLKLPDQKPFNAPCLYPLKTLENRKVTVFRGYRKGALGMNGLSEVGP